VVTMTTTSEDNSGIWRSRFSNSSHLPRHIPVRQYQPHYRFSPSITSKASLPLAASLTS
jgi:hypothetical protein